MTTSVEATGKNIEQAIENALFELKVSKDDVDIKILSEGGLFKKAKVIVSISEDAIAKYEKRSKRAVQEKEEEKKSEKENSLQPKKEALREVKKEVLEPKPEPKKVAPKPEKKEKDSVEREKISATEFLKGVIDALGKQAEITETEEEDAIKITLTGEGLSELIGYRGEALFALSYIMTTVCKRESKRQILDVCGYREKRADALKSLAERMATKVAKTGRYARLEPMDASERRQIHLALQDNDKVTTMSKGSEPKRYIIIFPRDYEER